VRTVRLERRNAAPSPSVTRIRRRARRAVAAASAAVLVLALSGTALGHVALESSDPPDGATLDAAPGAVTLTFTEDLDPGRSNFTLVGPAGTVGSATVRPEDPRRLVLPTPRLEPGDYEVRWAAVGMDAHLERGIVRFTVASTPEPSPTPMPVATTAPGTSPDSSPQAPSPAPTDAVVPSPSPGPDAPTGAAGDIILPIVAALVLLAGMGLFLLRRSRAG
jgi:copper resistance protein C